MKREKMTPYDTLPQSAFWRTAVASRSMFDVAQLWTPRTVVEPSHNVVCFGSCFAQHFGRALQDRGYSWLVTEHPPQGLSDENAQLFNYGVFSCRTGNIYTTSLLKQWMSWAAGHTLPPDEIWEEDGAFYDPFRPRIEPGGFGSAEEVRRSRDVTINALRACVQNARFLVFTMGLTESWVHAAGGYEYPVCPGVAAGRFDPAHHQFVDQGFDMIRKNLNDAIEIMRQMNDRLQIILTVSPVPLVATNTSDHVLVASSYSKSVLRAIAGEMTKQHRIVDYFPSYEIIANPAFQGAFFEPNKRTVSAHGVRFVMEHFFASMGATPPGPSREEPAVPNAPGRDICEEELLDAFRGNT